MIADNEGLTLFTGILAVFSSCVGGGIVGLPYSFLALGIPLGILLHVLVIIATGLTMRVYLALKNAVPGQLESLYELGFMIQGRKTIFFVASAYIVFCLGACIIYFMTFGDTMG